MKMQITLSNVRISKFASQETTCFTAKVLVNGKLAFVTGNDGQGGSNYVYVEDRVLTAEAESYVKSLPPEPQYGLPMDMELYVGVLLGQYELQRQLKRLSKTNTLFRLTGEDDFEIRYVKGVGADAEAYILQKYPNAKIWKPS